MRRRYGEGRRVEIGELQGQALVSLKVASSTRRSVADEPFAFILRFPYRDTMQSQNPFLDELAKAANAAVGLAQAAGDEAKAAFRSGAERFAADMDLVRRDEFEAQKAEIAALRSELASLRTEIESL